MVEIKLRALSWFITSLVTLVLIEGMSVILNALADGEFEIPESEL